MARLVTHNDSTDSPPHFSTEGVTDDASVKYEGIDSRKFAGESNYDQYDALVVKGTTAYIRFRFRFTGAPTGSLRLGTFQTEGAAATAFTARLSTGRKFRLFTSGGAGIGSESAALSEGEWHDAEIEVPIATSGSSKLTVKLDGATLVSEVEAAIPNEAIERWRLGNTSTGAKVTTLNIDTVAINDSTGPVNNGFPGTNLTPEPYPAKPAGPRLRWAPPILENATVEIEPAEAFEAYDFKEKDGQVVPPQESAITRQTQINNAKNVVWIGGKIELGAAETGNVGIRSSGCIESIHLEGIHVDINGHMADALVLGGQRANAETGAEERNPDVTLENMLVEGTEGEFGGLHADILQPQNPTGKIRIHRMTGIGGYQGPFLRPEYPIESVTIEEADFETVGVNAAFPLWLTNGSVGVASEKSPHPIYFGKNVYVKPKSGKTLAESVFPVAGTLDEDGNHMGAVEHTDPATGRNYIEFDDENIHGRIWEGPPPGGHFITPEMVGFGYTQPEYGPVAVTLEPESEEAPELWELLHDSLGALSDG